MAEQAPPLPLRALTAWHVAEANASSPAFNATILMEEPLGDAERLTKKVYLLHVDGPKARVNHGGVIQIERRGLSRLWLLDLAKQSFLDVPLAQDVLPLPAALRQHVELELLAEETVEGHPTRKVRVRMPPAFLANAFSTGIEPAEPVEMVVWYAPALGAVIKREGPGKASMRMTLITVGPQDQALFMIPDGFRIAGPPALGAP